MSKPDLIDVLTVLRQCAVSATEAAFDLVDEISKISPEFNRDLCEAISLDKSQGLEFSGLAYLFDRGQKAADGMTEEGIAKFADLEGLLRLIADPLPEGRGRDDIVRMHGVFEDFAVMAATMIDGLRVREPKAFVAGDAP